MNRGREYFSPKQPKKYKKVIYEDESDSEPELGESQYEPEDPEEEIEKPKTEKKKAPHKNKNNNIFDYLNNDAKRNKS